MSGELFDPKDIPAELRQYFEEVQVVCGAGWARVIERQGTNTADEAGIAALAANGVPRTTANLYATKERGGSVTIGWRPTCTHDAPPVPGVVLDPFFGSGSTGIAADRLGRDCIGIDLNQEYTTLSVERVTADAPLFADVSVTDPQGEPSRGQLSLFAAAPTGEGA